MILKAMLCMMLLAAPVHAEVVRIDVKSRADVLAGQAFGAAGPYEKLSGTIYFAVDPRNPANQIITDIDKAPKNAAGKVEFSSDFYLIKPKDPTPRQRHAPLRGVQPRRQGHGRLLQPRRPAASIRRQPAEFGDGFLLEQGFTLLWVGWQFDPPLRDGLVRVYRADRTRGRTAVRFRGWCAATSSSIETRDAGLAGRPRSPRLRRSRIADDPANVLTVRDSVEGPRRTIPRDQWQFTEDGKAVRMAAGFEPEEDLRSGLHGRRIRRSSASVPPRCATRSRG